MAEPFNRSQSTDKGVAATFRRRSSITLELVEDLFARASSLRDVKSGKVDDICHARGIELRRSLAHGRAELYRRYLKYCLDDNVLSEHESADLTHLRGVLQLSPDETMAVHDSVAIEVYGEAVQEVLADFQLDDDEARFLERLRADLHLPEERADQIFRTESAEARQRAFSVASSRDTAFSKHRVAAGEFTGRSVESLEAAINDAIAKATLAIPGLYWFEVSETLGYVEDGSVSGWHVTIRAGIRTEELR